MSNESGNSPGFAPSYPTDGRDIGNWKTRYPKEAQKTIILEAIYLGLILLLVPCFLLLFILLKDQQFFNNQIIRKYSFAWLGGTFGGVLFSLKWLYHSIAKNIWNEDRRLWRLFTPHLSGGFSFAMVVLISSNLINVFNPEALNRLGTIFGIGFLTGYFSDYAIGKFTDVAKSLFGTNQKQDSLTGNQKDSNA
ncbi:MAG: hypothetical protein MUO72_14900 [Bacteroidales bacterium]|nr:hypothetical protein [Bacteroidales bacterium]